VLLTGLTGVSSQVLTILSTGLTGQSKAETTALFRKVVCMHSSRGSFIGSGGACMCAWGLFVGFELWIGGLCSLLEHAFVSDVSSRFPCLTGSRLVFFK
jgi:hypothetical protein